MEVVRQTVFFPFQTKGKRRLSFDQYWSTTSRTTLKAMPVAPNPMGYQLHLTFLGCSIQRGMQYPARGEGHIILSPVLGQTQSNFQAERRQAEGKSMPQSVVTEQPSSVLMYRLVQVTPGSDVTVSSHLQSCLGIPQSSISSMKQTEERTPQDSKTELENDGSVYHTARVTREDLRHTEEPLTEAELRTKERKTAVSD